MHDLDDLLKKSQRLLFIGVGNVLKRDDGVGVIISEGIIERHGIRSLTVEVCIENYIGKINSLDPGEIIIVDCIKVSATVGTGV